MTLPVLLNMLLELFPEAQSDFLRISADNKLKAAYLDRDNSGRFSLVVITDTEDEEEFRIILDEKEPHRE